MGFINLFGYETFIRTASNDAQLNRYAKMTTDEKVEELKYLQRLFSDNPEELLSTLARLAFKPDWSGRFWGALIGVLFGWVLAAATW